MKKPNRFGDVRTLEDLDAALRNTREEIAAQGETVRDGLVHVQEYYTPRHLALSGWQRFALENNLYTIALNAVGALKRLLQK